MHAGGMDRAQWARKTADELRTQAYTLRRISSQGSYVKAARKGEAIRRLEARAGRLERIAAAGAEQEDLALLPF